MTRDDALVRRSADRAVAVQKREDGSESRALVRETIGAFGLLGTALVGLTIALAIEPGFLSKVAFVLSGAALWTCALVAIWPRTRRFAARINRVVCPSCGTFYRVSTEEILADVGNVRPSKERSPSGFPCYEVMCRSCGRAHRFRRSAKLVGEAEWCRDKTIEERARTEADRVLEQLDRGAYEEVAMADRLFWDGATEDRDEWIEHVRRGRGALGRPRERHNPPEVSWTNHPDGIAYVHYLEERHLGGERSPFDYEDYVSFTWTTIYTGVAASECVMLGLDHDVWCFVGYRIDGVADYVQLDGVGRLSLGQVDERGALSAAE